MFDTVPSALFDPSLCFRGLTVGWLRAFCRPNGLLKRETVDKHKIPAHEGLLQMWLELRALVNVEIVTFTSLRSSRGARSWNRSMVSVGCSLLTRVSQVAWL